MNAIERDLVREWNAQAMCFGCGERVDAVTFDGLCDECDENHRDRIEWARERRRDLSRMGECCCCCCVGDCNW